MRTHFLRELDITGKEKALKLSPSFDFYKLRRIVRLTWESHSDYAPENASADLIMTIAYEMDKTDETDITFRFAKVARCKLPELLPLVFLSEVEVEDVKDAQLEGIHYIIKNYGTTEFEIECKNFEITAVRDWQLRTDIQIILPRFTQFEPHTPTIAEIVPFIR